jgi:hypothetical protein
MVFPRMTAHVKVVPEKSVSMAGSVVRGRGREGERE